MRVRSLIAVSALALSGLAAAAPAAVAAEPEIITRTAAEVRADCASVLGSTYHLTSCYRSAPGNQYRAGVDCTNSGWRYGPWRNQTANLSTQSRIACPAGGTAQAWRIQFRTN